MTRSNRTLNRVFLALVGLLSIGLGAALSSPFWAEGLGIARPEVRGAVDAASSAASDRGVLWPAAAGCLVAIVLALLWVFSRGRGRTPIAHDDGVLVEVGAVRDLARRRLESIPAVLAVGVAAYRLRGRTVLHLVLSTRRRADLVELTDAVRAAVAGVDDALGVALPTVVEVRSGWRSAVTRGQRAE